MQIRRIQVLAEHFAISVRAGLHAQHAAAAAA
jgi:hypothetical protein